jgi:hypothetical protein
VIADASGRAVPFALAPGQAHELPEAPALLARLPGVPGWVVVDRSYISHEFRERIWALGAPGKRGRHTSRATITGMAGAGCWADRSYWSAARRAGSTLALCPTGGAQPSPAERRPRRCRAAQP